MLCEVGIRPVVWSSWGSRTSKKGWGPGGGEEIRVGRMSGAGGEGSGIE